jgi:hypothetical protein
MAAVRPPGRQGRMGLPARRLIPAPAGHCRGHRRVGQPSRRRLDPAYPAARDLAASIGPRAAASAIRAEVDSAEPDDLYVARLRQLFEIHSMSTGTIGPVLPLPGLSDWPVHRQLPAAPRGGSRRHQARNVSR